MTDYLEGGLIPGGPAECTECMRHGTTSRGERQAGLASYEAFRASAPAHLFDDDAAAVAR